MGAPLYGCLTQLAQRVGPGEVLPQDDNQGDPGAGPGGSVPRGAPGGDGPPHVSCRDARGGQASPRDSGFASFRPVEEVVSLQPLPPLSSPPVFQPGHIGVAGTGQLTAAGLPGGPPSAPPGGSGVSG